MSDNLEKRVRKTIRDHGMLFVGEHVVVAVSGGPDSTALLLCLHAIAPDLQLKLTAAHLNHQIRGAEADADEAFVREMSAGLGIPFISETIDIKQQAKTEKQNLEELARQRRYDFLLRTARDAGAQKIAVGHTLNDQAETALFRFLRGSGIEGLSAIHPVVQGTVIRPLLECSRDSVLRYLKRLGAGHREDLTNKDFRHSRNRIRQELLPYLEKHFNPQLTATLAREAGLAREAWSFIESQSKASLEKIRYRTGEGISLRIADFLKIHPALQKQVLREALREWLGSLRGIASSHIEAFLSLFQTGRSGAQVQFPHGCAAIRQFHSVILLNGEFPPSASFSHELEIPGRCFVPEIPTAFSADLCSTPDLKTIKEECSTRAFLEPSVLPPALTIRSRTPGDRYGGPGHRKVKKMLINSRVPFSQRSRLPMVAAGASVIWIPGFRPARGYEAQPGAECVLIRVLSQKSEVRSQESE